jgi:hypothetical protein
MSSLGNAISDSIGRRGIISTTSLIALTLYGAKECLNGAAKTAELISRVAVCAGRTVALGASAPGWTPFKDKAIKNFCEIYQPIDQNDQPTGDNAKVLAKAIAKSVAIGIIAFDIRTLVAGPVPNAYNRALSYLGPFSINQTWKGPLVQLLTYYVPAQVKALQNLNFII